MTQMVEEPQTNLPIAEKINPLDPVPDLPQENKSTWHVKTSLILHLLTIKKRTGAFSNQRDTRTRGHLLKKKSL